MKGSCGAADENAHENGITTTGALASLSFHPAHDLHAWARICIKRTLRTGEFARVIRIECDVKGTEDSFGMSHEMDRIGLEGKDRKGGKELRCAMLALRPLRKSAPRRYPAVHSRGSAGVGALLGPRLFSDAAVFTLLTRG